MAYPRRLLTDDEEIIREFHPHWRVLLMAILWVVVGLAVVVVGRARLGRGRHVGGGRRSASIAALSFAVPRVVAWRFRLYVLTTERIVVRSGVLSRGAHRDPAGEHQPRAVPPDASSSACSATATC